MSRISRVRLIPYRLPLARPWVTAGGTFESRQGWLLRLEAGGGAGFGDCAPLPAAGGKDGGECASWWENHLDSLRGRDLAELLADGALAADTPTAVACALECAALDLQARLAGMPLRMLLAPAAASRVPVNAMLGALDSHSAARALAAEEAGFDTLKLKIGHAPPDETLQQLEALATRLSPGTRLRLDANQAWTSPAAVQSFLEGLEGLPVQCVEEPLSDADVEQLGRLHRHSPVPIALDESLGCLPGDELIGALPGAWLILKPMRLGGLRPALALARRARPRGCHAVCTSVVESAAGLWATAQLAACLDAEAEPAAHGLATSAWLAGDLGRPPPIEAGRMRLPDAPGSGFVPYD